MRKHIHLCQALALWLCVLGLLLAPGAQAAETSLLANGDFSQVDGTGLPVSWRTDAWITAEGYTVYSADPEAGTATVNNLALNDARLAQTVRVEPESLYCFSADLLAENVSEDGWGANLSVEGIYAHSTLLRDTAGEWVHVDYYGETGPDQKEITVYLRMGGYSGESTGKASFRNVRLTRVQAVPGSGVADRWYKEQAAPQAASEQAPAKEAAPFWPWLLALGLLYAAVCVLLMNWLMLDRHRLTEPRRAPVWLWAGLAASFALRLILSMRVAGYAVDVNCFTAWAGRMAANGPGSFYSPDYWCDYPPAYMLLLGLNARLAGPLSFLGSATVSALAVTNTLLPMLCDVAMAAFIYYIATQGGERRVFTRNQAAALSLLTAFNPVLILNSACWKQIDSVLALLLMLVAWLAIRKNWKLLMPVYVLAVLVKPQALMLGFLGLEALILVWIRERDSRRQMLIGVGLAAAVALAVILPFGLGQDHFGWLIERYQSTLSSYYYATVNTANLYYLFNGNWVSIETAAPWGVSVVLMLVCLGWGAWCRYLSRGGEKKPLPWLEPGLMGVCALFFLVCVFVQPAYSVVGYGAMAVAFLIVLPLMWRGGRLENLPLLGGLLFLLLFALGIKMHERYLFPAIVFFAMAFALRRDRRTLLLLAVASCTMFINVGIPLDNSIRLGSSMGHLNNDNRTLAMIISVVNLLTVPLALWLCGDVCMGGKEPLPETDAHTLLASRHFGSAPGDVLHDRRDPGLHWKKRDTALILAITAAYAVVGFWNLGSTRAPQTAWTSTAAGEQIVLDLGAHHDDFSMAYFCRVSYSDFTVAVSEDGENWSEEYWAQMAQGDCFRWKYLMPSTSWFEQVDPNNPEIGNWKHSFTGGSNYADTQKLSGRYVRITAQQINLALCEVIFRESAWEEQTWTGQNGETMTQQVMVSGAEIPAVCVAQYNRFDESSLASDGALACDEPGTLEGEPGWYNSTYFDEIYHARTAWEHYRGQAPYETTHPPLGKVLMSWCVAIFGMTPFGWRFAGCLAGVLMVPAMYLLGKQLTKRSGMAAAAALLMALDSQHYAQTRIATIDSFPVLFIILCFLFMLRFMQRDTVCTPLRKLLPDLALSGLFMGCAVSSKWIGAYAGIGLAVLYFWTLIRAVRFRREAVRLLHGGGKALTQAERERLTRYEKDTWRRLLILCAWCVLFFIVIPLGIYLLSYIPYLSYRRESGLSQWLRAWWQAQESMLSYHSEPGRGMDHPFYSPWYEWPIMRRPMYYSSAAYVPKGTSRDIWCFGNPAIWYTGLAGLAWVALRFVARHRYTVEGRVSTWHPLAWDTDVSHAFLLVGFLAQFLPWALVPRGTYIYHYFASVPFLILALVLLLDDISQRWPRAGRIVTAGYLVICLAFFILLFPYASGMTTSFGWLDFARQFVNVYYIAR